MELGAGNGRWRVGAARGRVGRLRLVLTDLRDVPSTASRRFTYRTQEGSVNNAAMAVPVAEPRRDRATRRPETRIWEGGMLLERESAGGLIDAPGPVDGAACLRLVGGDTRHSLILVGRPDRTREW